MKRLFCLLLAVALCAMAYFPVTASAAKYAVSGTDMTVELDDSQWYVFTRDNVKDNPELEEFGLTEEDMNKIFRDNYAYMDAILFYGDVDYVELFVRKKAVDSGMVNLSNYDDDEVEELTEELAKKQGAKDYEVFETRYKYAKLEYVDESLGYYLCEFFTVVNKEGYTLTFQSTFPYTDAEYEEIERIVRSVRFDVDESLKEKKPLTVNILRTTAVGAVVGGAAGGVMALINKKKKKARNSDEVTPV
jgi:hypothetical protein